MHYCDFHANTEICEILCTSLCVSRRALPGPLLIPDRAPVLLYYLH